MKAKELRLDILLVLSVVLVAGVVAVPCAGDVITVNRNGTGDYLTIQEGIDAANPNDVVVDAGGLVAWGWSEIVDQTGESADMSFILFTEPDWLNVTAAEYADWIVWGRPKCWCCPRQCRGDIDGLQTGPFRVAIPDLTIFKTYFNQFVVPQCDQLPIYTGPYNYWTSP